MDSFDLIVIGGGHAGVEASSAGARMGVKTLLISHKKDTIGQMSCNPAIGGIGKSHLAKEVDALGGLMAKATDLSAIHYRVLNATKGQAVRATRAQTDRQLYREAIQELLKAEENLTILEDSVEDVVVESGAIKAVITSNTGEVKAKKVVLTTGTFLGGIMHTGLEQKPGGRIGDPPSNILAQKLRAMPFRVGRLKTGTPPRLDGETIDWSRLSEATRRHPNTPHVIHRQQRGPPKTNQLSHHTNKHRDTQNNKGLFRQITTVQWSYRGELVRATAPLSKTKWLGMQKGAPTKYL